MKQENLVKIKQGRYHDVVRVFVKPGQLEQPREIEICGGVK